MKGVHLKSLSFPLILLGPKTDRTVEIIRSLEQLTTTTKLGLKEQSIVHCTLVDARGEVFEIESITKIGNRNPFWKFEFFNPMIEIDVGLKKLDQTVDLFEIKEHAKFAINQNPYLWGENFDLSHLKKRIDASSSIEEIMRTLTTLT